jgi:hypothetical protein
MSGTLKTIAVWTGCIAPTAALNILPHAVALTAAGPLGAATLVPHVSLALVKAATVVGMAYLPVCAEQAETRSRATICWALWLAIATLAFFHAMEGAGRLRDSVAAPVRDQQRDQRDVESRIARYEQSRLAVPPHVAATAEAVTTAQGAVDAAVAATTQECEKNGPNCRARRDQEAERRKELTAVTERRGLTEQMEGWDAKIDEAERERAKIGRAEAHADPAAARVAMALTKMKVFGELTEDDIAEGWPIWLALVLELWAGLGPYCFLPRTKKSESKAAEVPTETAQPEPEVVEEAVAGPVAGPKKRGAASPAKSRKPLKSNVTGPDTVRDWFAGAVKLADGPDLRVNACHEAYSAWATARGMKPVSIQTFGSTMKKDLGVNYFEKSKRGYYTGIVITSAPALRIVNN